MEVLLVLLAALVLLAGPVALIIALLAVGRSRRIEQELAALRREIGVPHPGTTRAARRQAGAVTGEVGTEVGAIDADRSSAIAGLGAVDADRSSATGGVGTVDAGRSSATGGVGAVDADRSSTAAPPPPLPPAASPPPSRGRRDLESRIGSEWLTWIGVLAIFFGTAFFLAVRLGNHPLAGQGQVWVGLAVAVAFLGVGSLVTGRSTLFLGQGLLGGGTALVYLAIFAASTFHQILGLTTAYLLLAGASLLGAALAVIQNSRTVAGLTLIGALLTPLLLESATPHPLFFPYLLFVSIGASIVRMRKDWPGLVLGSFVGSLLIVTSWWDRFFSPETRMEALLGVGLLWLLYLAHPVVVRSSQPIWKLAGSVLVLANAAAGALFLWTWLADTPFLRGLLIGSLGLVYVLLGRIRARPELQRVYELAGLALGAIAVPVHFDLETVTVGWSLFAVILVHLGLERGSVAHRVLGYLVLAAALGHHAIFDLIEFVWDGGGAANSLTAQWVAGLTAAAAILAVAGLLQRARQREVDLLTIEARSGTPLVLTTAAFVLFLLSFQVWRGLEDQGERRVLLGLSFTWALYGGALIGLGFLARYRALRLAGVGLLLAVVAKVFTLDISVLERGERIASFIGVGVLLLVVSLLYQKGRGRQDDEDE